MSKPVQRVSESLPSGNLRKGIIQIPLQTFRVVASNDIPTKNAADGGLVSKDTDPIYERVNGATDKALRLSWASASVIEAQAPSIAYPPDLDDAAPIVVNVLAVMKAASVDVPVIAVGAFEGIGDTNAGGNTAALSTSLQKLTVTLAAADVGPYPTVLSLTLKPGTHATSNNDVYVYGVWLEYTRKA
jgi:hypothetical protein